MHVHNVRTTAHVQRVRTRARISPGQSGKYIFYAAETRKSAICRAHPSESRICRIRV